MVIIHMQMQDRTISISPENFMKIDWISLELYCNMYKDLTDYCKYVTIEMTMIDIHSNNALVSVAGVHSYVSWKFHED